MSAMDVLDVVGKILGHLQEKRPRGKRESIDKPRRASCLEHWTASKFLN
jgi:hypothetical protein